MKNKKVTSDIISRAILGDEEAFSSLYQDNVKLNADFASQPLR